jgi:hypothetical protein
MTALVPMDGDRSLLDRNVTLSSGVLDVPRLAAEAPTATTTAVASASEANNSRLLTDTV